MFQIDIVTRIHRKKAGGDEITEDDQMSLEVFIWDISNLIKK